MSHLFSWSYVIQLSCPTRLLIVYKNKRLWRERERERRGRRQTERERKRENLLCAQELEKDHVGLRKTVLGSAPCNAIKNTVNKLA